MPSEIAVETRMWLICKKGQRPMSVSNYGPKLSTYFLTPTTNFLHLQPQLKINTSSAKNSGAKGSVSKA